jgi:formylglycine-generating enzyme
MSAEHSCCAPSAMSSGRGGSEGTVPHERPGPQSVQIHLPSSKGGHGVPQVRVEGGRFFMGDAHGDGKPADGEGPVHPVTVSPFTIDATAVTNVAFARFVDATGYRTEAETFGVSAVFHLAVRARKQDVTGPAAGTPWWLGVRGADWRHPGGPLSDLDGLGDHPVVHVSWNDARAYSRWAGRRLPTEAQWEYASRGGLEGSRYPWGDEVPAEDADGWPCNIWQGQFPMANTMRDGFLTTAPVESFRPNGYGLWQTVGNVWEWCADWFNPRTYELALRRGEEQDPSGPAHGQGRVMRGGSYLCHDSYCNRYRNAARTANTPDSSTGNVGFRTVGSP